MDKLMKEALKWLIEAIVVTVLSYAFFWFLLEVGTRHWKH